MSIALFGIPLHNRGSKCPSCEYKPLCNSIAYLDISGSDRVRFGYYFNDVINAIIFILSCYNLNLLLFFLQDVIRSPLLAVHPRRENLDVFFNLLLPLLPLLLRGDEW